MLIVSVAPFSGRNRLPLCEEMQLHILQDQFLDSLCRQYRRRRVQGVKKSVTELFQAPKFLSILSSSSGIEHGCDDQELVGKPVLVAHHILKALKDGLRGRGRAGFHDFEPACFICRFEAGIHKDFESGPGGDKTLQLVCRLLR
jgi:hypothetical protein